MKAIFRKSTSFILALAMIIGILPMASAATYKQCQSFSVTDNSVVYNFTGTSASADGSPYARYVKCDIVDIGTDSYGITWQWELDKDASTSRYATASQVPGFESYGLNVAFNNPAVASDKNHGHIGFRINVPKAGTYIVSMSGYSAGGSVVDVLIDGENVGEYGFGSSSVQKTPEAIGIVTIGTPGVHSLVLSRQSGNSGIYPTHIALTPISEIGGATANEIVYDFSTNNSLLSKYLQEDSSGGYFALKVNLQRGVNWEINKALSSSDIANPTHVKKDLRIQAAGSIWGATGTTSTVGFNVYVPKSGKYSISMSGYKYYSAVTNVLVNGQKVGYIPADADASVGDHGYTADAGYQTVTFNKGVNTIVLQGTGNSYLSPGKIILTPAETWEDRENQVFNLRGFNAATEDGKEIINVSGKDALVADGVSLANGWNWEFVPEYCHARLGSGNSAIHFQPYGLYASMNSSEIGQAKNSDVALKLKVSQSGWYKISAEGAGDPSGGGANYYLNGVYLGSYSYNNTSYTPYNGEKDLRTVYVEAGDDIILTMRSNAVGNQYPGVIRMTAVDAAPAVTAISDAAVSATTLDIGESATVSGTVAYGALTMPYMEDITDGAGNVGANAIATVVSSDENVLKVEGGKVVAVSAGTATVKLVNGNVESNAVSVTVNRAPANITNKAIFGDVSAYITKDGNFVAFSGIDTTEYKEVGFYIALDDGSFEKYAVADGKVYKSINVISSMGTEDIDVADFFRSTTAGENAHIFFSGTALGDATTVKFYPYAVPVAEGAATLTGYTYSVSLS